MGSYILIARYLCESRFSCFSVHTKIGNFIYSFIRWFVHLLSLPTQLVIHPAYFQLRDYFSTVRLLTRTLIKLNYKSLMFDVRISINPDYGVYFLNCIRFIVETEVALTKLQWIRSWLKTTWPYRVCRECGPSPYTKNKNADRSEGPHGSCLRTCRLYAAGMVIWFRKQWSERLWAEFVVLAAFSSSHFRFRSLCPTSVGSTTRTSDQTSARHRRYATRL